MTYTESKCMYDVSSTQLKVGEIRTRIDLNNFLYPGIKAVEEKESW